MDEETEKVEKKNENFFMIPHWFEKIFGDVLTPNEKYFYVVLKKLENRYGDSEGKFWHKDRSFKSEGGNILGFESYGFSISASKRARKHLKQLGLIETTRSWYVETGNCGGTSYKIMKKPKFL